MLSSREQRRIVHPALAALTISTNLRTRRMILRLSTFAFLLLLAPPASVSNAFTFASRATSRIQSSIAGRQTINHPIRSPSSVGNRRNSMTATEASLKPYIETLIKGERSLTSDETRAAFSEILRGADEVQVGSLLTLLRARGETPAEIAGMVQAMNDACNAVDLGGTKLLDIVGTGGDGADTINISTASVVLSAACGCVVAKCGNRSVSSACGSADVLEALGVKVDLTPDQVVDCVKECNVAFMFAPVHHASMKHVAPVRKKLGVRTCFNILGPMTNPAGAQRTVIGVFHPELMALMAGALEQVARVDHAVIIHGVGLDEISPLGPASILEIKNTALPGEPKVYERRSFEFDPTSVGIPKCELIDLKGGGPKENAEKFLAVLQGGSHTDAKRDSIVLNAGMGCYVYGLTPTIEEGCALARRTLEEGKASDVLKKWISVSQKVGTHVQVE